MKAHELANITTLSIEKHNITRVPILLNEIMIAMKRRAESGLYYLDFMFTDTVEVKRMVIKELQAMGYVTTGIIGGAIRISWAEAQEEIAKSEVEITTCKFDIAWVGPCKRLADASGICSDHKAKKCCLCGKQATRECDATFALVCGAPLCSSCSHHGR